GQYSIHGRGRARERRKDRAMVATQTSLSLPKELIEEIQAAAEEADLSKEVLIRAAVRRFLDSERRWRSIQAEGAELARAAGLFTEDDVEVFMDSLENGP
ncbi:MAG: ribbon-helix-helix protein, CopG family, partial [Thermomicrobiales bacterium]